MRNTYLVRDIYSTYLPDEKIHFAFETEAIDMYKQLYMQRRVIK